MSELGFIHHYIPAKSEGSPVLLMLHGTGGNHEDLIPLGRSIAPEAALLSPHGKTLENGMPRFFKRHGERAFDLEDMRFRTDELAEFLVAARTEYQFTAPLVAIGYSNGANIAANVLWRHPGILAGAVLLRGMAPFELESPADLKGVPVLISGGRHDSIALPEQTEDLQAKFEACGAEVSLHWHEGGHELGRDDIAVAKRWLEVNWPV